MRGWSAWLAGYFHPKLVSLASERYRLADFRADSVAGLTVAIVALPLAMALAVASGADPGAGLITAIVAGFIVSALVFWVGRRNTSNAKSRPRTAIWTIGYRAMVFR